MTIGYLIIDSMVRKFGVFFLGGGREGIVIGLYI
jgi:hypothetical protein